MTKIPEASKLIQMLTNLQGRVDNLEKSSGANQLANSSIEVTEGQGFIPILENGVEKHRIGRQPDGTVTSVSVNNFDPPAIPNIPTCTPFISGVTVTCTGFQSKQYLDFSHINVYVNGTVYGTLMKVPESTVVTPLDAKPYSFQLSSVNLSGQESRLTDAVIATPNLVVSQDIQDGIVDELKLADLAVTHAKIAAEAVKGSNIAAETIEAANIAAAAINADKIAAEAITADKIQALAITANKIAANAITAGVIQAGSITTQKLAAQIILATVALIVGDPLGARLTLDATGLTQSDAHGNITFQVGNQPGSNSLTVVDPNDSTNALASIDSKGTMTMAGININGTASLNGIDLIGFLNSLPRGVVSQGQFLGSPVSTNPERGLFELSLNMIAGRVYRIESDPVMPKITGILLRVRYTIDGSVPTTGSQTMTFTYAPTDDNNRPWTSDSAGGVSFTHAHNQSGGGTTGTFTESIGNHYHVISTTDPMVTVQINTIYVAPVSGRLRVLFTYAPGASNNTTSFDPTGVGGVTNFTIEDIGTQVQPTGGSNTGSGSSSATGQYIKTYTPTYTKYITDAAGATMQTGLQQGKAGSVNYMSMLGFAYSTIQSDLASATIQKVELYLYSNYWALTQGGTTCVGTHNAIGTNPTSYSYVTRDVLDQPMKKPQGLWLQLPTSVGTSFQGNTIKGLVLDSRIGSPGVSNYGMFRDISYTDATVWPALRITYIK